MTLDIFNFLNDLKTNPSFVDGLMNASAKLITSLYVTAGVKPLLKWS